MFVKSAFRKIMQNAPTNNQLFFLLLLLLLFFFFNLRLYQLSCSAHLPDQIRTESRTKLSILSYLFFLSLFFPFWHITTFSAPCVGFGDQTLVSTILFTRAECHSSRSNNWQKNAVNQPNKAKSKSGSNRAVFS